MEGKIVELEEEYLGKIAKIWDKEELMIEERIKMSLRVVDDIDKVKWPKGVPVNLLELAKTTLKATLLLEIKGNVRKVLPCFIETSPKVISDPRVSLQDILWKLRN